MTSIAKLCDEIRLREAMAREEIDLILASSRRNVAWLTDHQTEHWSWEYAILHMMEKEFDGVDYLIFAGFPLDAGKRTFLVEYAHREDAVRRNNVQADDFYGYWQRGRVPEISGPGICLEQDYTRTSVEAAAQAIRDRGLENATIGIEFPRMAASVRDALQQALPHARFVDAFDLLFSLRQIKSEEEIRRIRHAYEVATSVYRDLFPLLHIGAKPRDLLVHELTRIYQQGCTFSFAHLFFGEACHDIAFTPPADHAIQPGDIGTLDLGVVYRGYGTDYARMAHAMPGNKELVEILPPVLKARKAIEAALVPGAKARDVFMAGARALEEHGLCASISCLGHGIGLGCHEKPFITANSDDVIQVGQTLVIEMYSEVKGVGPILIEDGGLVTPAGWECFSDIPLDLIEIR